ILGGAEDAGPGELHRAVAQAFHVTCTEPEFAGLVERVHGVSFQVSVATLGTRALYDKRVPCAQAVRQGEQSGARYPVAEQLDDLAVFVLVARAGGFRQAARERGVSASLVSEAVRRLEARLGVRLLHRSTRSVVPTEAGVQLLDRLVPALGEIEAALDVVNA